MYQTKVIHEDNHGYRHNGALVAVLLRNRDPSVYYTVDSARWYSP